MACHLAESEYLPSPSYMCNDVLTCILCAECVQNFQVLDTSLIVPFLFPGHGQIVSDRHPILSFVVQPDYSPRLYVFQCIPSLLNLIYSSASVYSATLS